MQLLSLTMGTYFTDIGYEAGYSAGYTAGYNAGYIVGNAAGYSTGYGEGHDAGYAEGYDDGYAAGLAESPEMPAPPELDEPGETRVSAKVEARILRLERLVDYLFGWLQSWKDLF